ncbi:unnamed protein product [Pseudo-nitzschia multistriata]|uniref:AMP-dependent synthetase/ligase domain-containing protein n=1 Tax=Pseudo-nitzschia multistriata TaxID=183589 RepID=A0A448ZQD9_9STRA|nr:unnamed protein product [Pseudo-nitzschia multistriata]
MVVETLSSVQEDHPALCWSIDKEREIKNCYWSRQILELFHPFRNNSDSDEAGIHEKKEANTSVSENDFMSPAPSNCAIAEHSKEISPAVFSTSYKTLLLLAAGAARQIQEEFCQRFPIENTDDCEHVINDSSEHTFRGSLKENTNFAVAIPEGPMLPLAILVVYALNAGLRQQEQQQSRCLQYAVLVPMDPDEGKNRNSFILNDTSPSFVLAIPGEDSMKLQELIENQGNEKSNEETDTRTPRLLDFVELVKTSRSRLELSSFLQGCTQSVAPHAVGNLQQHILELATQIDIPSDCQTPAHQKNPSGNSKSSNRLSHIVYTSGTTGHPKGCISSARSLRKYIDAKNDAHDITPASTVLLASSLSFDPCLSDVVATLEAGATLAIAPRINLVSGLTTTLLDLRVTHVLCTPTLWGLTLLHRPTNHPHTAIKEDFPCLQRVALGGEPIQNSLVVAWARSRAEKEQKNGDSENSLSTCRLLATYGVTEACVYQTCGEVFRESETIFTDSNAALATTLSSSKRGQYVGHPLDGTEVKICREDFQGNHLEEVREAGMLGEIVLYGDQIDITTGYLNRPDLVGKFVAEEVAVTDNDGDLTSKKVRYHYRTGDRGYINPTDRSLSITGRIVGEEGMIKINGVRVELGEIEAALTSGESNDSNDDQRTVVTDCLAKVIQDSGGQNTILAYCVFPETIWKEIGISLNDFRTKQQGVIINGGPLWSLLRIKCSNRLRKACIPSTFVGIPRLPLSRTGKRDRLGLPGLSSCSILRISNELSTPLEKYGLAGSMVVETLVKYLNLQPCQQQMLTKSVSFAVLGGDSLSAVVVCRTLYARCHQIQNSRFVGGEYGQLPEPFDTVTLLRAQNLGDYVDLLDETITENGLLRGQGTSVDNSSAATSVTTTHLPENGSVDDALLYDALLQATTMNQSMIAKALLSLGANPNRDHAHGSRIGNTSGRNERRAIFKTAPLHLACFRGDAGLVKLLLAKNASFKSPNTNGVFPIHLAAGGIDDNGPEGTLEEDARRLDCVKLLLSAGCPLLMKDANKQSILHAAARGGHCSIIEFVIAVHQCDRYYNGPVPLRQFLEFQDRWFRSAVHWAVINGRVRALKVLLEKGCDPSPFKPKSNKQTSMTAETPLEICQRLYGGTDKGKEMEQFLRRAINRRHSSR